MKLVKPIFFLIITIKVCSAQNDSVLKTLKVNSESCNKLVNNSEINETGFKLKFLNIDSVNETASMNLYFHFPKKSFNYLYKIISSDSSLKSINHNFKNADKNYSFQTDTFKFILDSTHNHFISQGEIPIIAINGQSVNKYINGVIEYRLSKAGNKLCIYLEINPNNWYFFDYSHRENTLVTVSSEDIFNNYIKELKPNKRELNGKKNNNYYLNICPPSKKTQFLRQID